MSLYSVATTDLNQLIMFDLLFINIDPCSPYNLSFPFGS